MDCEKLICTENSTIKDVMSCIDSNAKGTAFIVDENKKLVGIATDGDIRRALLNGAGLKEIIKTYMNNSFIYASDFVDAQRIFQKYDKDPVYRLCRRFPAPRKTFHRRYIHGQ